MNNGHKYHNKKTKISTNLSILFASILFAMLSISVYGFNNTFAQNQGNNNNTSAIDCQSIATNISNNASSLQNPNADTCSIIVLRQSPQIIGHNGTILNKFVAINSLVEITPAPANMSNAAGGNATSQMIVAMGEFALLEPELKPMLMGIADAKWNVTAIHNHAILEKPDMIFVHWDAMGDLATFTNQSKTLFASYDRLQQQSPQVNGTQNENPLTNIGEALGGLLGQ
jgi:uncharacterized protein (UPF0333 family)